MLKSKNIVFQIICYQIIGYFTLKVIKSYNKPHLFVLCAIAFITNKLGSKKHKVYSTVTLFARLRGLSTSISFKTPI